MAPTFTALASDPDEIELLDPSFPIVLLPVRLETRFAGAELRVRIYPDEIAADAHEPELTASERQAGETYWTTAWTAAREADAWAALLAAGFTAARAAWIARALTPTNLAQRPAGAPAFPTVAARAAAWTRAAHSRVLPDRWFVVCTRGDRRVQVVSHPVADPLPLTTAPSLGAGATVDISGDGLRIDAAVAWTVDFDRAVTDGMAVRVPLDATDAALGFDRVLVFGVKAALAPAAAATRLAALLDAHHYGRGLEFLRAGTPTNNTSSATSGFPAPDPGGAASFAVERGHGLASDPGAVGARFARALGIPTTTVEHIAGADRPEDRWVQAMHRILWPATLGYFLEQLLDPIIDASTLDEARRLYIDHVRGRGPLPALRVGAVPYGVLPVSSVALWAPSADALAPDRHLPVVVKELHGRWRTASANVARLGRSGDRDRDLIDILAMDAATREVWIRTVVGGEADQGLESLLPPDNQEILRSWRRAIAGSLLNTLSILLGRQLGPTERPRIVDAIFSDQSSRFAHGLVADGPVSETAPLDWNYLAWMHANATLDQVAREAFPGRAAKPTSLLYRMARHALLQFYGGSARDALLRNGLRVGDVKREIELVQIRAGTENRPTVWDDLATPIAAVSGNVAIGDHLRDTALAVRTAALTGVKPPGLDAIVARTPEVLPVATLLEAFETIEALPSAEIERLFTEGLDVCSHRLDAWITTGVSRRLEAMRATHPTGAHLGAFGWVEDLRPATPDKNAVSGGWIHAPSMVHAAAGAVLRNAYLTRSGGAGARYAVDLSSARVRAARWLLDGVRQGQPLRALAGSRFERGLHRRQLDRFIEMFRVAFPLPDIDAAGLSARDVVDGEALRLAFRDGTIAFVAAGVRIRDAAPVPASAAEQTALQAELRGLEDTLDAVADALVADSVYQLVRGSTTAAAAALDATATGVRPPDPEITRVARGGTAVTHRVGVVLGGDPVPAPAWQAIASTARAGAEPYLDHWVGRLLGDPAAVRCRIDLATPTARDPAHRTVVQITLAQLALRPLDVLALARTPLPSDPVVVVDVAGAGPVAQGADLQRRIVTTALGAAVQQGAARILFDRAAGWSPTAVRTFPEILELARAINAVLGGARPLAPSDLLPPEAGLAGADLRTAEADARAASVRKALAIARAALDSAIAAVPVPPVSGPEPDLTSLRAALATAAQFVVGAQPPPRAAPAAAVREALLAFARSIAAELARRVAAAAAAPDAARSVGAALGRDFLFLPRFTPGAPRDLGNALAVAAPDAEVRRRWLAQLARVRPALSRWRTLALYADCLGTGPAIFDVAQLPFVAGARWAALPFGPGERPVGGRAAAALFRVVAPPPAAPWVGLAIDEWHEVIPAAKETTGLAVHHDAPGAEAAQAVLIAVPPAGVWNQATLETILDETFDLAKIRAVDFEVLDDYAQILPAVYLAANAAGDTVATDFTKLRMGAAGGR